MMEIEYYPARVKVTMSYKELKSGESAPRMRVVDYRRHESQSRMQEDLDKAQAELDADEVAWFHQCIRYYEEAGLEARQRVLDRLPTQVLARMREWLNAIEAELGSESDGPG
jgi:hypothetical protein